MCSCIHRIWSAVGTAMVGWMDGWMDGDKTRRDETKPLPGILGRYDTNSPQKECLSATTAEGGEERKREQTMNSYRQWLFLCGGNTTTFMVLTN